MKAGKKLINRLRSRAGESIAEVLVAVLISALGMAILAGMVAASSNMVAKSKTAMQTFIREENQLSVQSEESGDPGKISTGTITMKIGANAVKLPDSEVGNSVAVTYFTTELNDRSIAAYSVKGN